MNNLQKLFDAQEFDAVHQLCTDSPPRNSDDWVLWGRALLALGKLDLAVEQFTAGLRADSEALDLSYYLACAMARQERWREIENVLAPCLDSPAWRSRALGVRAQVNLRGGFWARAAHDYRELDRLGALRPQNRLAYAACLVRSSQWKRALELLDEILAAGGDGEIVRMLRGQCLERTGHFDHAEDVYREALKKFPESQDLGHRRILCVRDAVSTEEEHTSFEIDALLDSDYGRGLALREWQSLQKQRPDDPGLVHRLAILQSFTAARLQQRGHTVAAAAAWRSAMAEWVVLEHDYDWQRQFVDKHSRTYNYTPVDRDRAEFSAGLSRKIGEFLEEVRALPSVAGVASIEEDVRREQAACEAARTALVAGGFLGDGVERPFVCGPVLLAQLGRDENFSQLCGEAQPSRSLSWTTWPDPEISNDPLRSLRWLYSSAGHALSALQKGDWRGALQGLRWCACPKCSREHQGTPKSCSGNCPEFANRNPGLSDLEQREHELAQITRAASVHANVAAAHECFRLSTPDGKAAIEYWTSSLKAVEEPSRSAALSAYLESLARARIRSLADERRYTESAELGQLVLPFAVDKTALEDELVKTLINLGVTEGHTVEGLDALRTAVGLRPNMLRARRELIVSLMNASGEQLENRLFDRSVAMLDEAKELLDGTPDMPSEFCELLEEAVISKVGIQIHIAGEALENGKDDVAIKVLQEALTCDTAAVSDPERSTQFREQLESCQQYLNIVRRRSER